MITLKGMHLIWMHKVSLWKQYNLQVEKILLIPCTPLFETYPLFWPSTNWPTRISLQNSADWWWRYSKWLSEAVVRFFRNICYRSRWYVGLKDNQSLRLLVTSAYQKDIRSAGLRSALRHCPVVSRYSINPLESSQFWLSDGWELTTSLVETCDDNTRLLIEIM